MNKKSVLISLILVASIGITSCGPKRYKCGPYRRCEVNSELQKLQKDISLVPKKPSKTT